ncbi:right-handed parallel beta-helix repeat-containing protein [candidate division WOR-3 bacterium]|nr:right-handed parallel beta-helix repeat-containing protein [candidate division WOR-3 bacterium]
MLKIMVSLFSAAILPSILHSAVFYVNDESSFQNALIISASNGQNDTIIAAAGNYDLTSALLYNSAESYGVFIAGAGSDSTVLTGDGTFRLLSVVSVYSTEDIAINGVGFSHGGNASNGGGVLVETSSSRIFMSNCMFEQCQAQEIGGGAALITNSGDIFVTDCHFDDNTCANDGGGLNAGSTSGSIALTNSTFNGNRANGDDAGGALLYCENGSASATGNSFSGNYAQDGGGGLFTYFLGANSSLFAQNNTFTANHAVLDGAGFFVRVNDSGSVCISSNNFIGNTTTNWNGGGISLHLNSGTLNFSQNQFNSNYSGEDGGGAWIWIGTGTSSIQDNIFSANTAQDNGGGISFTSDFAVSVLAGNIFFRDSAGNVGGGLSAASASGSILLDRSTFFANRALEGGGIYYYSEQSTSVFVCRNIISWSDLPNAFSYSSPNSVSVIYSDLQGGTGNQWFGTGCIEQYPIFADTESANLQITWANFPLHDSTRSPCIDAGDPSSSPDLDGTRADQGALYYNQLTYVEEINRDSYFSCDPFYFLSDGRGNVFIRFSEYSGEFIEVFVLDVSGRNAGFYYRGVLQNDSPEISFSAADLCPGVYFVSVQKEGTCFFRKMSKINPL